MCFHQNTHCFFVCIASAGTTGGDARLYQLIANCKPKGLMVVVVVVFVIIIIADHLACILLFLLLKVASAVLIKRTRAAATKK